MADLALPGAAGASKISVKEVSGWLLRGEVGLAVGVIAIILLLVLPVPAILIDLLLA
ncbi:MAG: hypothetical protein INR64_04240, partial [Caulobacteraceae bacterium]|nr:hypothetical protein [Caulobacter sp.]